MQVSPQVTNKSRCGLWTSLTHLNFFDNFKFHPSIFKKLMNAGMNIKFVSSLKNQAAKKVKLSIMTPTMVICFQLNAQSIMLL
jgi:hypothetical protein